MANTRRRVKLYVLNDDRQWDDRGTGHVSSCYVERLNGMCLLVRSETDGSILLESKIQLDTAYQKQQETLIVWSENDNYDLALSFQEKAGCDEVWEIICQIQGKDPSVDVTQDIIEESEEERFEEMPDAATPIELPPCELSKLDEIAELFSNVLPSPVRREKLAVALESERYLPKLVELFRMCEDLENAEGLQHLFEIIKTSILLNKNSLLEILFSDDIIYDVIGCLEYDPAATAVHKHREYLNSKATFKEVIPIANQELLNKIHQTYRVQYIQDVILPTPSVFEENMLTTLNSFIFFNKLEIVEMIQEDDQFLPELFTQLTDEATEDKKRRDLVLFLKEFCSCGQACQNRDKFFRTLSHLGILPALEVVMGMDDSEVRQAAVDIFAYIVEYSPSMVREFILQEGNGQEDDVTLINQIIEQMICDADPDLGSAMQLMNILRILLDPENMMATVAVSKTEKTEFLSFFYKHCMHILTAPLLANTATDMPSKDDYQTAQLLGLILELLTFCIEHHTYHIKNYIISKDLLRRVLVLLQSTHQFLVLCAIRLVRKMIARKDEFFNRYIIKGSLMEPVVRAFKNNGNKYNLLNSAIIELFEFIRLEDIKSLIVHIEETYSNVFDAVDYVSTFKGLKLKYEQHLDRMNNKPNMDSIRQTTILQSNRYRRDARALDEDEELWFDREEEVEDADVVVPMAGDTISPFRSTMVDAQLDSINRFVESKKAQESTILNKETLASNGRPASPVRPATGALSRTVSTPRPGSPVSAVNAVSPISVTSPTGKKLTSEDTQETSNTKAAADPTPDNTTSTNSVTTKGGVVGLVDYPDEDSDEEDDDVEPPSKRARIAT
ncbi:serine/threonine-protein phosphatase 4 regulatory subunit 3A-like isoform X2 [Acanthaster planci]|uniref:Serine/threonine-protein phosphatase 4 regulatory subunit 3A-like isoform X2 n=1 Tax=Acanthaster planci TaxID=133434 RepID=A0A8B7ZZ50_ACAPL|nr:serine/threonine-protein phosphatase 4 regulatory subunit 3A-like isoform X2 [Acanthaster planci]